MDVEERYKLYRQIMWDYSIVPDDIDAVLQGKKNMAGHYSKDMIVRKLLESYSWFTIVKLFGPEELSTLLSNDVINGLRQKSLKSKYEFVQKRLQEVVVKSDRL